MHVLGSQGYMKDEFPFWITRAEHGSVGEHGHEFVELAFVVRGKGFHIFQGAEFAIRAGDVFIINPGETHAYSVDADGQLEIINCLFMPSFIPDALLSDLEITGSMDYYYVHPFLGQEARFNHHLNLHGQDAAAVMSLLERMIGEMGGRRIGFAPLIRLQLVELLLLLSRCYVMTTRHSRSQEASRQLDRVLTARRIYGYLERNYDKKITLQSLSALFNVSTRHLNRLVGEEYGRSVFDLLHFIRIEHAKRLLLESDEKVIAVATMVGYDDPSFFSRLFVRHAGCSPREFRAGS